jgi:hypothetical protein
LADETKYGGGKLFVLEIGLCVFAFSGWEAKIWRQNRFGRKEMSKEAFGRWGWRYFL